MTGALPTARGTPEAPCRAQALTLVVALLALPGLLLAQTPAPAVDRALLGRRLVGQFSNEAQAPLGGITPGGSDRQPQDRVVMTVRRVRVPVVGGDVFYVQWNRDQARGPVIRQRLWAVASREDGTVVLRIYGLRDTESYADALEDPQILETLTAEDLVVWPAACDAPWSQERETLVAVTQPGCQVERSGQTLTMQVRVRMTAAEVSYAEVGYGGPDLTPVFALPKRGSYEFVRVK